MMQIVHRFFGLETRDEIADRRARLHLGNAIRHDPKPGWNLAPAEIIAFSVLFLALVYFIGDPQSLPAPDPEFICAGTTTMDFYLDYANSKKDTSIGTALNRATKLA